MVDGSGDGDGDYDSDADDAQHKFACCSLTFVKLQQYVDN